MVRDRRYNFSEMSYPLANKAGARFPAMLPLLRLIVAATFLLPVVTQAQEAELVEETQEWLPTAGVLPATSYWKFGLEVSATGAANGVKLTVPVPIEWPDQQVEILSIESSDNVSGAKVRKHSKEAKILFFRVNQMEAGDVAQATVTIKVEKLASVRPADTTRFQLAESPRGSVKKHLKPSLHIESKSSRIRELAEQLARPEGVPAWDHVESIYQWVRENIEYEFDPQIRSCLEALDKGKGDCEELTSLFIAICRAQGIPARAVWIPNHTYAEFYLLDESGEGHWFPCQCAGAYAFGEMPEVKPILQKGDRFKVPGYKEPQRYLMPTLEAEALGGQPQISRWIMEPVKPPQQESSNGDSGSNR